MDSAGGWGDYGMTMALNDGSVRIFWSSLFTWEGLDPPGEGDIVVIAGKNIFYDTATHKRWVSVASLKFIHYESFWV